MVLQMDTDWEPCLVANLACAKGDQLVRCWTEWRMEVWSEIGSFVLLGSGMAALLSE